jgi:hypothetical protein
MYIEKKILFLLSAKSGGMESYVDDVCKPIPTAIRAANPTKNQVSEFRMH